MKGDGPSYVGEMFKIKTRRDPTLSSGMDKGIRVSRPILRLFPTRIEGVQGRVREAIAAIGYDEASGAQLAGALVRLRSDHREGLHPTWGQLRTSADAELIRDALDPHVIDGVVVVLDSYTDELLPAYYRPPHVRDRSASAPRLTASKMPCPVCDNVDYGEEEGRLCRRHWDEAWTSKLPSCQLCGAIRAFKLGEPEPNVPGHPCKRHYRADYEASLTTYEALNLVAGEALDEHNTPPSTARGIPSDPTGDRATARADTGDVDGLIRDEILTSQQGRVVGLSSTGLNLHEIGREMGIDAGTVAKHLDRARRKLNPRRRRLTWREEIGRSVPVVGVRKRQPQRSLLGQHSDVMPRGIGEVACPLCHLIVRRGLMRDLACSTCSETFSDSLSTNGRLVPLSGCEGTSPLFLAIA
jgi:DNA-binding CsgD family transcriptional regulator